MTADKLTGIVLRNTPLDDSTSLLTLLTAERGKENRHLPRSTKRDLPDDAGNAALPASVSLLFPKRTTG